MKSCFLTKYLATLVLVISFDAQAVLQIKRDFSALKEDYYFLFSVAHNSDMNKVHDQILKYNIKSDSQILIVVEIPKNKVSNYDVISQRLQKVTEQLRESHSISSGFSININGYFEENINYHKIHVYLMK